MPNEKRTDLNCTDTPSTTARRELNRYIGFDVYDKADNKIGTLDCLWSDHTGQPAFLGVKTGWIFGKTHVVPAKNAEVNEKSGIIRLPYPESLIKGAPAFDADMMLDEATERDIYNYYHEEFPMEERPRFDIGSEPKAAEETRIPLREEELKVGKRQVEAGGVRLRKIVRTETVNQPVELQREEIVIERVAASDAGAASGEAFAEQDIFIPLRREEPVVQTESRVREEVRASKRTETERQQVSGNVRKEDVQVERKDREGSES
jgi:uncharacterized protein (TIGR02271 family)